MFADRFALTSTYLNSAYLGPTPKRTIELTRRILERTADPGSYDYAEWSQFPDQNRARLAGLLGGKPENVAWSTSVSELVSHVANGLELHPQDEILLLQGDYPSMVLPWMVLAELKGFRIHFLELQDFLEPARFKSKVTDRTRFAGCSHVMFNTGIRLPVAELGRAAREAEILFLADVSQSFGGMRIAPEIVRDVDILVGVAYKWLLGPFGSAFGYFSDHALKEVRRTHASWLVSPNSATTEQLLDYTTDCLPGARKFDRGQSPSYVINAGLEGGLETLKEAGLEKIEHHNARLVEEFLEHLPKSFRVAAPASLRSNIVCVQPQGEDAMALKLRLSGKNINVSVREGSVRLSFHLFNSLEQVHAVLRELGA